MKKILLMGLWALAFSAVAVDPPESAIVDQKYDQERCVQDLMNRCHEACKTAKGDPDCVSRCQDNAKNECRQAGE
ncbi:hypothetical protein Lrub_1410 [Legionella rubrilucens]|uniref:Uncharacterized protein n=1 Tax=Legionella rubrilucens TaxID=458 RepID=A0A0W0XXQ9_9GAMM|nr:hypothetical protein [Legionella rubrilucens]KTD49059.1 hypothetical protein Lrub_1410 [Legionella rubrilucens]